MSPMLRAESTGTWLVRLRLKALISDQAPAGEIDMPYSRRGCCALSAAVAGLLYAGVSYAGSVQNAQPSAETTYMKPTTFNVSREP